MVVVRGRRLTSELISATTINKVPRTKYHSSIRIQRRLRLAQVLHCTTGLSNCPAAGGGSAHRMTGQACLMARAKLKSYSAPSLGGGGLNRSRCHRCTQKNQ